MKVITVMMVGNGDVDDGYSGGDGGGVGSDGDGW